MKTEKEINTQLKLAKKNFRNTKKQFEKYDNHDDLDLITVFKQEIETLEWVLSQSEEK